MQTPQMPDCVVRAGTGDGERKIRNIARHSPLFKCRASFDLDEMEMLRYYQTLTLVSSENFTFEGDF